MIGANSNLVWMLYIETYTNISIYIHKEKFLFHASMVQVTMYVPQSVTIQTESIKASLIGEIY